MKTLVYRYGMRSPTGENLLHLQDQIRKGWIYRKQLTESVNNFNVWRCAQARELGGTTDEIEAKKVEIERAREAQMNARIGSKSKKTPVETKILKQLQTELKEMRSALPRNPELPIVIKRGEAVFKDAWKLRRKDRPTGLHDGTYNLIEASVKQAMGTKLKGYFKFHPRKPIPARLYVNSLPDEGTAGRQIYYPKTKPNPINLFEANSHATATVSEGRMQLRLKINSKEWVDLDVNYHRPLPEDARIMRVDVGCRRIGTRMEWCVRFTVQLPTARESSGVGNVGIDIGWRRTAHGLKVASLSDGSILLLPNALLDALSKSSAIQAQRDLRIAEIADTIAPFRDRKFPWTNAAQVVKFYEYWSRNRKEGDDQAFVKLAEWVYRDNHLHNYADGMAVRARRWRKDIYRVFAARTAKKFRYLAYENFNLADKAMDEGHTAQYARGCAAISELKSALENVFGEYNCLKVDAHNTTKRCNSCGSIEKVESHETEHTCSKCGVTYDRDVNAAKNICERMSDEQIAVAARDKEIAMNTVGKRKMMSMKKEENNRVRKEMESACKALDNAAE